MIAAGKSTAARELQASSGAMRFSPDEWLLALAGDPHRRDLIDRFRDTVERLQWQTAFELLERSQDVILEFGFWQRAERKFYRDAAQQAGHAVALIWMDAPPTVLAERVRARTARGGAGVIPVDPEELYAWLDAFEPPDPVEQKTYEHFEIRRPIDSA